MRILSYPWLLLLAVALGVAPPSHAETILAISMVPGYPGTRIVSKGGPLAKIDRDGTFSRARDRTEPGAMENGRLNEHDVLHLVHQFSEKWADEFRNRCFYMFDSPKYSITVSIDGKARTYECEIQDSGPVNNLLDLVWKLKMIR